MDETNFLFVLKATYSIKKEVQGQLTDWEGRALTPSQFELFEVQKRIRSPAAFASALTALNVESLDHYGGTVFG